MSHLPWKYCETCGGVASALAVATWADRRSDEGVRWTEISATRTLHHLCAACLFKRHIRAKDRPDASEPSTFTLNKRNANGGYLGVTRIQVVGKMKLSDLRISKSLEGGK